MEKRLSLAIGQFSLEYRGRLRIVVLRSRENNYKRQIHATPYLFKEHT
jgi:hypothetical protein